MQPLILLSRLLSALFVISLVGCSGSPERPPETHALLDSLDACLERYESLQDVRDRALRMRVDSLPALDTLARLSLYERIAADYLRVNVDSALFYLSEAGRLADSAALAGNALRLRLLRFQAYPLKGMLHQAIVEFERISPARVPPASRRLLFETGRRIYLSAADVVLPDSLKRYYRSRVAAMTDSLIASLPPSSLDRTFFVASRDLDSDNEAHGLAEFHALLKNDSVSSRLYAAAAAALASYYIDDGRDSEAIASLARSAIADLSDGVIDTASVYQLGQLLFEMGHHRRAYAYLSFSLERAVDAGARLKVMQAAESLPMVKRAIIHHENETRRLHTVIFVALGLLVLTLAVIVFISFRHRRRLEVMRAGLGQSVALRDSSIRQLVDLLCDDLQAFHAFCSQVSESIRNGRTDSLRLSIESGEVMRMRLRDFYEVFDSAFLNVFPDFPRQVNSLFLPDRRLQIPPARSLSPELRLLAFMRLGIDDSEHISRFMGLSVHTVYTYRNALRRRAADRENFEKNVGNIGKIS